MSEENVNRLIHEKSPYLLQHAHNPVDWYPWGNEAFEAAKSSGMPIFLSIGYATCHWCHVMESESFQDQDLAKLLNETFINIKVDREELPEVDSMYMEFAAALMSAGGGWPLNVILTPDLKPFFAVTYLPPDNRRGMMGLRQVIEHIDKLWKGEEKKLIFDQADKIVEIFEQSIQTHGDALSSEDDYYNALETLFELADPSHGGLKGSPKFPVGYLCELFLSFGKKESESRALFLAGLTLEKMQRGGIYDHIGGGFSRYSVDDLWMIPHFEKMLYDNAFLISAYCNGGKCLDEKAQYLQTAKETMEYILHEMTSPEGGFYSAQDADTEGIEGAYYTWTKEEIISTLSAEEAELFSEYYRISQSGNFKGTNVLYALFSAAEFAENTHRDIQTVVDVLASAKEKLLQIRKGRSEPFKDDKILSSWNGIMIDACIKAGSALKEPRYTEMGVKAAEFLRCTLFNEGQLLRRYRDGEARFSAGLGEYAYVIKGLITLFEFRQGVKWLKWAIELCMILEKEFKSEGGAFFSVKEGSELLFRQCEYYDGAEPSGNAVHAENLLRLHQITQDISYLSQAEDIFKAVKPFIENYPPASAYHLLALGRYYDLKAPTIIVALDEMGSLKSELDDLFSRLYLPHAVVIWKEPHDELISQLLPNVKDKTLVDGQTAVYLCLQNSCKPPMISITEIETAFSKL